MIMRVCGLGIRIHVRQGLPWAELAPGRLHIKGNSLKMWGICGGEGSSGQTVGEAHNSAEESGATKASAVGTEVATELVLLQKSMLPPKP